MKKVVDNVFLWWYSNDVSNDRCTFRGSSRKRIGNLAKYKRLKFNTEFSTKVETEIVKHDKVY